MNYWLQLFDKQAFCRGWPVWILIFAVIFYRLFLPVRAGQFGPDESEFAMRACTMLKAESFPLIGFWGHRGVPYGPYPIYFYTMLYGLTDFHLGWAFLIYSLLFIASAFLVAASTDRQRYSSWTFLLALTSPAVIFFSMSLWDNSLLILVSALVLYLARPGVSNRNWRDFVIGLLLGVSLGIHLMAVPFVAGVFVWRFLATKRINSAANVGMGIMISVLPYAIGVWRVRDLLLPSVRSAADPNVDWLSLPTSLFRFWGLHPLTYVNVEGSALWLEQQIGHVTIGLIIVLLFLTGYVIWKALAQKSLPLESHMTAFILCAAFYLPFAFITNSSHFISHANPVWWFAPVVIPLILLKAIPGKGGQIVLSCLVVFNILATTVQFVPRMITGTSAELMDKWGYGLGASWWMQEDTAREVCAEVARQSKARGLEPTLVKLADVKYIADSLPNLIKIKHPDCFAKIKWVPHSQQTYDIFVEPDEKHLYLKVIKRSSVLWYDSNWAYRKAVVIENGSEALQDFQVSFPLNTWLLYTRGKLKGDCSDLRVTDMEGKVLPYWIQPNYAACPGTLEHPKNQVWVRAPEVPKGKMVLYAYYGNPNALNIQSWPAVFEYFDDFNGNVATRWEVISGTGWETADGNYVNSDVGNDTSAYRVLAKGFAAKNGVIETRIKLTGDGRLGLDAGPAFRMVDAYNGYAVRIQADGVFSLRKITDGESSHIAFVSGVVTPEAWHVVKAVYNGSLLQAYLDGRMLIDTADRSYTGVGRVGLYKDRGNKDYKAIFDWIFVRKYAPIEPVAMPPENEEKYAAVSR